MNQPSNKQAPLITELILSSENYIIVLISSNTNRFFRTITKTPYLFGKL